MAFSKMVNECIKSNAALRKIIQTVRRSIEYSTDNL